jgi:hypothetical protein
MDRENFKPAQLSTLLFALLAALVAATTAWGQQGPAPADSSTEDLQRATQNPVASLISVPLQDNTNFGIGPFDRNQNVLNIQPVIPTRISEKLESDYSLDHAVHLAACARHGESAGLRHRRKHTSLLLGPRCSEERRGLRLGRHDTNPASGPWAR